MSDIKDDTRAFPGPVQYEQKVDIHEGMSLRAYAAIKLRIPDSGIHWLDEMIMKEKRDEFAAAALQGLISSCAVVPTRPGDHEMLSEQAFRFARAMLKERSK